MVNLITRLQAVNPDLTEAEVEGLLYLLANNTAVTCGDLIRITGLPKETMTKFLASVDMSDSGLAVIRAANPRSYKWTLVSYTGDAFQSLVAKFSTAIAPVKLKAKREFDQFFATPETSVAKALVLQDRGLLTGKRIALLGDDDFTAIAIGLIGGFTSITVFDVDRGLLDAIKVISTGLGINNIQTVQTDIREGLNSKLAGAFDVVVTDPPYTKVGVGLFLNRAVELLGKRQNFAGKYVFLYYGNSFKSPEKTIKIQELISKFNLVIEDKIAGFAHYIGASSIGSASSLYILKTTPFTHVLDESNFPKTIYTFENQKEEKFPYVSHFVFKLFGVPQNLINSKVSMLKFLGKFCETHRLKVVDQKTTVFKGNGLSFTFILSSSNLVVHTWPEYGALHLDLITCTPIFAKELMGTHLKDLFWAVGIEVRELE